MEKEKLDMITFKVPESLREAMKGIPNRSEFIRAAVVAALDSICPLCKGTGVIMPSQRPHCNLSPAIIISRSVTPVMQCMWFATGAPMKLRMFMKLIETAL